MLLVLLFGIFAGPVTARAQCEGCDCEIAADYDIAEYYTEQTGVTAEHIGIEFLTTENWLIYVLHIYLIPMLQGMAEQLTTTAMMQTFIFGTFLDAQQQLTVQRTLQELTARAHKDYQPSDELCMFGTVTRSLGATMLRGEANGAAMSQFGAARRNGASGTESAQGPLSDRMSRLKMLRSRYCAPNDDNGGLDLLCDAAAKPENENRDVDFSGVMDRSPTLDIDMADQGNTDHPTGDEQDIWALAANLYGHEVQWRPLEWTFKEPKAQQSLINLRSVNAARAVAEASFYTIAGLKSQGTPGDGNDGGSAGTVKYMNVIMQQLGVPVDANNPDSKLFLGDRPSYYAQMEFLTKRIFQDARFYTNLYDTPANVTRKRVAMQAIGLMQDFDTLQSNLRTEMLLSQTLELELIRLQREVANQAVNMTTQAPK